jgi:hypothetical protein
VEETELAPAEVDVNKEAPYFEIILFFALVPTLGALGSIARSIKRPKPA